MPKCEFVKAWIGKCGEETIEGSKYCAEHSERKCWCTNQAITECDATRGPLVCGVNLCEMHSIFKQCPACAEALVEWANSFKDPKPMSRFELMKRIKELEEQLDKCQHS